MALLDVQRSCSKFLVALGCRKIAALRVGVEALVALTLSFWSLGPQDVAEVPALAPMFKMFRLYPS